MPGTATQVGTGISLRLDVENNGSSQKQKGFSHVYLLIYLTWRTDTNVLATD